MLGELYHLRQAPVNLKKAGGHGPSIGSVADGQRATRGEFRHRDRRCMVERENIDIYERPSKKIKKRGAATCATPYAKLMDSRSRTSDTTASASEPARSMPSTTAPIAGVSGKTRRSGRC